MPEGDRGVGLPHRTFEMKILTALKSQEIESECLNLPVRGPEDGGSILEGEVRPHRIPKHHEPAPCSRGFPENLEPNRISWLQPIPGESEEEETHGVPVPVDERYVELASHPTLPYPEQGIPKNSLGRVHEVQNLNPVHPEIESLWLLVNIDPKHEGEYGLIATEVGWYELALPPDGASPVLRANQK